MEQATFDTPVSYHIFNRPELTQKTFEVIKSIKPKVLFVTADGPRADHPDDVEKCKYTRKIIEQGIDWSCDLYQNYAETNKGSYKCTSDGISWVFKNVGEAIIIEDDCLPHRTFFYFCQDLLDRYKSDNRVALISGNNFLRSMKGYDYSYFFSRYALIWGWATWKRTWDFVNLEMRGWPEFRNNGGLKNVFKQNAPIKYWDKKFNSMYEGFSSQHWDYKLFLSVLMNNYLSIRPAVNLVSNIGAGQDGTHVKKRFKYSCLNIEEIVFPLNHPLYISSLYWADEHTEKMVYSGYERLRYKIAPFFPSKIRSLIGRLINLLENNNFNKLSDL